ncbi:hypothetical protein CDAR_456881 [Caerostris darwini]|uniref:Uncharacterized protein n=1 Tax=Caerostris darwini TaxID=1538125 RepID=A0AAV4T4R9_9ARAC|nr:hypothetical protein CDAR_456881 [Caerostris darwini]
MKARVLFIYFFAEKVEGRECFCVHPNPADKRARRESRLKKKDHFSSIPSPSKKKASGSNDAWGCQLKKSPMRMIHRILFPNLLKLRYVNNWSTKKKEISVEGKFFFSLGGILETCERCRRYFPKKTYGSPKAVRRPPIKNSLRVIGPPEIKTENRRLKGCNLRMEVGFRGDNNFE